DIDTKNLHVWNEKTPRPSDALTETKLEESLKNDCVKRVEAIWPKDTGSLKKFQETMRPALQEALGTSQPTGLRANIPGEGITVIVSMGEIPKELMEA